MTRHTGKGGRVELLMRAAEFLDLPPKLVLLVPSEEGFSERGLCVDICERKKNEIGRSATEEKLWISSLMW